MKKLIIILFAFSAITILSGCDVITKPFYQQEESAVMEQKDIGEMKKTDEKGDAMMEKENAAKDAVMEKKVEPQINEEDEKAEPSKVTSGEAAVYEEYTATKLAKYKGNQKVAVFFHASWCPSCRVTDSKIKENLGSLKNAVILKADYDTTSDLKKEFRVLLQDTIVFLNADGSVNKVKIAASVDDLKNFFSS